MPKNATCSRCGHKLAESNTTGRCYRPCKRTLAEPETIPSNFQQLIKAKLLLSILCTELNITEEQLYSADRKHLFVRQRSFAYYLLKHDVGMEYADIRKLMHRAGTDIKSSIDVMMRTFENNRHVIDAVRKKYNERLEQSLPKISA